MTYRLTAQVEFDRGDVTDELLQGLLTDVDFGAVEAVRAYLRGFGFRIINSGHGVQEVAPASAPAGPISSADVQGAIRPDTRGIQRPLRRRI